MLNSGFENRCTGNRTVGSNPTLSATQSFVFPTKFRSPKLPRSVPRDRVAKVGPQDRRERSLENAGAL